MALPLSGNVTVSTLVQAANELYASNTTTDAPTLPSGSAYTYTGTSTIFRRVILVVPGTGGYTVTLQDSAFAVGSTVVVKAPASLASGNVITQLDSGTISAQSSVSIAVAGGSLTLIKTGTGVWQSSTSTVAAVSEYASEIVKFPSLVNVNTTIPTGYNAMTVGPLTISSGITLTIPVGQRLVIL